MNPTLAIGIDLGATKIAAVLADSTGRVLEARQIATHAEQGPEAVLDRLAGLVNELSVADDRPVNGLGIGVPGRVNPTEGIVYTAVNLGWDGLNLAGGVRERLDTNMRLRIEKDTNASALGEYYFGAACGVADFVYLGIGSGMGSGIVSGGRLLTGATWIAGDLGHLSLDPDGLPCSCGLRGCVETLLSGPSLVSLVRRLIAGKQYPTGLASAASLDPATILSAARSGDVLAQAAFAEIGRCLGTVMAICVAALNPARFVIGGGLGLAAFNELVEPARLELVKRNIPDRWQDLTIVPSELLSSALGAACLAWYSTE